MMDVSLTPETCENFEAAVSALLDGELESPEQLPTVDHLLDCASCQAFYRRARSLAGMVASAAAAGSEAAPPEVWERIAEESGLTEHRAASGASGTSLVPKWLRRPGTLPGLLPLAAVLVLAIGLWLLQPVILGTAGPSPDPPNAGVDVVLEEDRGSMSEERFLELTTEILRADRSYHRKMLEVMSVVTDMAPTPEGSPDEPTVAARDGRRISVGEEDGESASLWSGDRL